MELSPFVDSLRRDLAAAAGAVGGTGPSGEVPDDVRAASERLLFALDPSVRLVLLDALGSAAAEVGAQLDDAAVEVRLRGRDPELVVLRTEPAAAPGGGWADQVSEAFDAAAAAFGPGPSSGAPPAPPAPPTAPVPPRPARGARRGRHRPPHAPPARVAQGPGRGRRRGVRTVGQRVAGARGRGRRGRPVRPPGPAPGSRHPGRRLSGWAR